MPTPQPGESRDDFLERCIPIVIEDGTADGQDQAVAVCSSMWEQEQDSVSAEDGDMKRKTFTVTQKAIDADAGIYEAMISTEDRDRDGDIILASGAQVDNYLKNPVVLFGHNYHDADAIVGKALEIEPISGEGVRARWQFVDAGTSPQADIVRRLWAGGFLNATSVGFIAKEQQPLDQDDPFKGSLISQWELLEFSIVSVPANQSALRLAIKALADDAPTPEDFFEEVEERAESELDTEPADELENDREEDANTEPDNSEVSDGGDSDDTQPEPDLDEATIDALQGVIAELAEILT